MATEREASPLHRWAPDLAASRPVDGWREVNSSGSARVAYSEAQDIYFKAFLPRSPLERLKALLRGSRATRARRQNELLRHYGFEAPQDLAWGRLSGGREYQFSTAVAGQGVHSWLADTLVVRQGETLRQRRKLIRELGRFIGRLHHSGFVHGDLRPSNVLADYSSERFNFALIDNERTRQYEQIPGKLLLKNLMQLNMLVPAELNRGDRWRFFLAWSSQMRELSETEARILAVEAYRWAMKRLAAKGKLAPVNED